MLRRTLLMILGCCVAINSYSQSLTPALLGFEEYSLVDEMHGEVSYYLSSDSSITKKPLLVYLDGSGAFPLFQEVEQGIGSTVVLDFQNLSKEYTILLISKPGVPFIDKVGSDENGYPIYEEPTEYTAQLSLHWRVNTANSIINNLVANKKIDDSKIVVFGFSEGAQVAPSLAVKNKNITHLLLFGGNGLNQFIDPIISARMKAATGQISEIEAQNEIDSLFTVYKDIYNNPQSSDKEWWGHTYKRWASFTETDPYKLLLQLDIPIYLANGSLDQNSVLSADYIRLEFIKNHKNNLTYKTYPNCDHQFNEIIMNDGQFVEAISRIDTVMQAAFEWLRQ